MKHITLKTDTLTAVILPELGGKIASLRHGDVELLQQPLRPYELRDLTMGFEESDASGFDECLPSVAACTVSGVQIPDHGEFWRLVCEAEQPGPNVLNLIATGTVLPLRFERVLTLEKDTLRITYRVENTGTTEVPYAWSAHPLFSVDAGDAIVLPTSVTEVTVEGSGRNRLGPAGTVLSWPVTSTSDDNYASLDQAGESSLGIGDKLFMKAPAEGWCALERKKSGLRVTVSFDPKLSPYVGLWLCYGGWPEGSDNTQHCVAIEPCNAPVDSLEKAVQAGTARRLAPGQVNSWWMEIGLSVVS
jgi:galactose mutarotase-like enzyme